MGRQPPPTLVALIVLVVSVVAVGAAIPRGSAQGAPPARPPVASLEASALGPSSSHLRVVGDSMSALGAPQLRRAGQAAGYDVAVLAIPGIRLDQLLGAVTEAAGYRDGPLVVELGTNDVLQHSAPADIDARIDQAVAAAATTPCALFVDVGILAGPVDLAEHFNQHLRDALAGHPGLHLYDWAAEYRAHADWTFDAVHLQLGYYEQYAADIVRAAHAACAPLATDPPPS